MIPMDSNMALYVVDTSVIGNTFPSLSAFFNKTVKLCCYCASPVAIRITRGDDCFTS